MNERNEQITPRSIDRAAFGLDAPLTPERVAAYLAKNPEVAERVGDRIHTGVPVEGTLARAGFLLWDCPECGTRVATKRLPPPDMEAESADRGPDSGPPQGVPNDLRFP